MALAEGDLVVPAAIVANFGGLSNIPDGTTEIMFGVFTIPGSTRVLWNNGITVDAVDETGLRKCAPGSNANGVNVGRSVQLSGASPAMRGVITASVAMELATKGGTGTLSEVYIVESEAGGFYVALPSALIFVD